MRTKNIASELAITANTTVHSTAVDLTVDPQVCPFTTDGNAVVAVQLEGVTLGAGDSVSFDYSTDGTNYTAQTVVSGALTSISKTLYLDRAKLGMKVRVTVVSTHSSGAGKVSCDIFQT